MEKRGDWRAWRRRAVVSGLALLMMLGASACAGSSAPTVAPTQPPQGRMAEAQPSVAANPTAAPSPAPAAATPLAREERPKGQASATVVAASPQPGLAWVALTIPTIT